MILEDFSGILEELVFNKLQNSSTLSKKILYIENDNNLFQIEIVLGQKSDFNNHVMDNSHFKFVNYIFKDFIEKCLKNNTINSKLKPFTFNFDPKFSYEIIVFFNKISKKDFLSIDSNLKQLALKNKQLKLKNKLYSIILESPEGIDLSGIIQRTRIIKSPDERNNILTMLINEKFIEMSIDESNGRKKRIYKALWLIIINIITKK